MSGRAVDRILNQITQTHPEILLIISQFLDFRSFINLLMVSKTTKRILDGELSWKTRTVKDFWVLEDDKEREWRDVYKERSDKYIILFLSTKDCSHCPAAKELWENIKDRLTEEYHVRTTEFEFEGVWDVTNHPYGENLNRCIRWFPCWFLFSIEEWDSKEFWFGSTLNGGPFTTEGPSLYHLHIQTLEGFREWIENDIPELKRLGSE